MTQDNTECEYRSA